MMIPIDVVLALAISVLAWKYGPWQDAFANRPDRWQTPLPRLAFFLASVWTLGTLVPRLAASEPPLELTHELLLQLLTTQLLLAVVIGSLLFVERALTPPLRMNQESISRSVFLGLYGWSLAIGPVFLLLYFMLPFRPAEHQHPALQFLRKESLGTGLMLVAVTAVMAAPIFEELLYRVALQGPLVRWLGRNGGIAASSCVFALAHGWRDAIPLIPLAIVLGVIYHQRRDLLACIVTHAMFNAVMLTLTLLSAKISGPTP